MNPDTFTLENLFAMELHNYKDVIADIVTSASKELSIEKVYIYLAKFLLTICRQYCSKSHDETVQVKLHFIWFIRGT